MLLQNKKVAIIGAGIAGLTLAKLLQQQSVDVKVYERDENETVRINGGLIDFHIDSGQKAFEKAGLLSTFYQRSRPTGFRHADIHANILIEHFPDKNNLYLRPEIDRNDLRMMLYESLQQGTVIWDRKFASIEQQGDQYLLHFENGMLETADLVVGADGIMSKVRKYITDTPVQYTGTVAVQGEVLQPEKHCPDFKRICRDENFMVIAEHKLFVSHTKAKGVLHYYVCFREPESWIKESGLDFSRNNQICDFLTNLLAGWDNVFKEVFAVTDNFSLLPMRLVHLENWKAHENITLIGDAAHGMPPYAGVGGNLGLMDALHLAENLTGREFADTHQAIENYERKMFAYSGKAQQETIGNGAGIFDNGNNIFLNKMTKSRI